MSDLAERLAFERRCHGQPLAWLTVTNRLHREWEIADTKAGQAERAAETARLHADNLRRVLDDLRKANDWALERGDA